MSFALWIFLFSFSNVTKRQWIFSKKDYLTFCQVHKPYYNCNKVHLSVHYFCMLIAPISTNDNSEMTMCLHVQLFINDRLYSLAIFIYIKQLSSWNRYSLNNDMFWLLIKILWRVWFRLTMLIKCRSCPGGVL